ncbi:hypothetical protein Pla108_41730 [Botrimarina colliarenosi]|uniref:Uncharacterized protein n=1 Tax=Botrimarina colliarenosi TaxID=2528001 RepID=A0A5C5ZXC5_9BACT|nr:hypothetical protein [Botrimarina colliarenosi]TWT91795.1 hypothetical protein Pla108_41730 [Botrimarina colliarenosi]
MHPATHSYKAIALMIDRAERLRPAMMADTKARIDHYIRDKDSFTSTDCGREVLKASPYSKDFQEFFEGPDGSRKAFGIVLGNHLGAGWDKTEGPYGRAKTYTRR